MYVFSGDNPTKLYYDAMMTLLKEGDEVSPRGKLIKELRPAVFEYKNPLNRVTFLGNRRINPFFQLAESLWIISGHSDVEWLCKFNANMKEFSDNGIDFNAPYGERIRFWNKNNAHNIVINPIDQLLDAYIKLKADKDTRQAVVVISNPMFDNSNYTINEKGKDIACNLIFTLKIRHNKLDITVFNRSNDLHWGVMGANLCQFSTIQEVMASWLGVEVGQYNQITDSLHIYLDTYGSKCTDDVLAYYKNDNNNFISVDSDFTCVNEPRMSLDINGFDEFLNFYWSSVDCFLMDDEYLNKDENVQAILNYVKDYAKADGVDEYWLFVVESMIAYRLYKIGKLEKCLEVLLEMTPCQLKISMLYFMKNIVKKANSKEATQLYWENVFDVENCLKKPLLAHDLDKYLEL